MFFEHLFLNGLPRLLAEPRNDMLGYPAQELAHALDNRRCHGSQSNDVS